MNSNSPEVLIVYNWHKRDAGIIPQMLSSRGLRYSLISNHEFVQLRPQLVSKHLIGPGGPRSAALALRSWPGCLVQKLFGTDWVQGRLVIIESPRSRL